MVTRWGRLLYQPASLSLSLPLTDSLALYLFFSHSSGKTQAELLIHDMKM